MIRVTGDAPEGLRELAGPMLEFVGHVDDLRACYDGARVAVAPDRYGAGVKLKVVEALQHGVPVVTTSIGAEGLPGDLADVVDIADDPALFARSVASLLSSRRLWRRRRARLLRAVASLEVGGSWTPTMQSACANRSGADIHDG